MKRHGTGRFVLALAACLAGFQVVVARLLREAETLGGVLFVMLAATVVITLVFSAIYDGPRALVRLVRPARRRSSSAR